MSGTCSAITGAGHPCANRASIMEYCGVHHRSKLRSDPEYKRRFEENEARAEAQERERVAAEAALAEARQREVLARQAANRARKQTELENALAGVSQMSVKRIEYYTERLMRIWSNYRVQGFNCPRAYHILTYGSVYEERYAPVMRACIRIAHQAHGNHPIHESYRDVPQVEREEVLAALEQAVAAYADQYPIDRFPRSNVWHAEVIARIAEAERQRAEERRRAEMELALRERAVVFQRDPEGGINLAAFATDTQNVHRSSVQTATQKAVEKIMTRPVAEGQETLVEITDAFMKKRWSDVTARDNIICEMTNDYFNTMAFSISYGNVLDRVWTFIRSHEHKATLEVRLAQELIDGRKMCSNGKMARLINTLQGFDDTLDVEPPREVFQTKFAALRDRPAEERTAAAHALLAEYAIPAEEHSVWLEALDE